MSPQIIQRWAKIGITAQLAALVRILAEYFRLRNIDGAFQNFADVDPWIGGALIAAALCWLAVTLYFFGKYRAVIATAALTVIILLAYKFAVFGFP